MAWIESHQGLGKHPKLLRLAGELRIHKAQAVGHLQYLWWWALDYARNGDLSAFTSAEISTASEWPGESETLLNALKKTGWLTGSCKIKDWEEYSGKWAGSIERQRRYRQSLCNDNITVMDSLRATVPDITKPNLTKRKHLAAKSPPGQVKPKSDHQQAIDHIFDTLYRRKGWIFGAADARIVKDLLRQCSGLAEFKAKWDVWLSKDRTWVSVDGKRVGSHEMRHFRRSWNELADEPWKARATAYEKANGVADPVAVQFNAVPKADNPGLVKQQAVESLKGAT